MVKYIKYFEEISINDVPLVGGENASLGEMCQKLKSKDVNVPDGFFTVSDAYWLLLDENRIRKSLSDILAQLDTNEFSNLSLIGNRCRQFLLSATLPEKLKNLFCCIRLLHSTN